MNRKDLLEALSVYETPYAREREFLPRFLELINHPRAYYRDHLPGHITASAWIIDETREQILLVNHAKLKRWLQPGGHADGEEDIISVALKEAREETGLSNFKIIYHGIFDIDIHSIPERNDFPEHLHYDIRILLQAGMKDRLRINDESNDLGWVHHTALESLTEQNTSMLRMAEKVKELFTGD